MTGAPVSATGDPPAFVDLHSHSTASDGMHAPSEVVARAKAAGLSALALTDHDTIAGLAEATEAAEHAGIRLVPGIELSAVEDDVETHVLGLHLARPEEMQRALEELRDMRARRARRIVERLNELGVRIMYESVLEQAAGGAIGRPHVARAMVAEGWATDAHDAFDRYLGNGKSAFVAKDRLSMTAAFDMIHRAGGLAVLAHPARAGTQARLEALAALGMDGVEVLHPSHGAEDVARLRALATHLDLVPSGGSDWHGADGRHRALGTMHVPAEWLAQQDARVSAVAARI